MTAEFRLAQEAKRLAAGYRPADKPPIQPACRNCKQLIYDSDDWMSLRGQLVIKKTNLRCRTLGCWVKANHVCNGHEFAYASRGDK